jgi:hypothetical protein
MRMRRRAIVGTVALVAIASLLAVAGPADATKSSPKFAVTGEWTQVNDTFGGHATGVDPSATLSYEIFRDGVPFLSGNYYEPVFSDLHHYLSLQATETFTDGTPPVTAISKRYKVHEGAYTWNDQLTHIPTIGLPTSIDLTYLQPQPATMTIHWELGRVEQSGGRVIGSGQNFKIPSHLVGQWVYAFVTMRGKGMFTTRTFTGAEKIQRGTLPTLGTPAVTGSTEVGSVIKAQLSRAQLSPTTKLSYQWFEQASPSATPVLIAHATSSSLLVSSARTGQIISVHVTATHTGYTSETVSSAPTSAVTAVEVR